MRTAALAAVALSLAMGSSALAAERADGGPFDKWLTQDSPECVPVGDFKKAGASIATLTPDQFQFVRALYVAIPPISRKLPPGDHAIMASSGDSEMVALVADDQACARFLVPDFIKTMLVQVGQGMTVKLGTPL